MRVYLYEYTNSVFIFFSLDMYIPRKINYLENSYGNWKIASEKENENQIDRSLCFAAT